MARFFVGQRVRIIGCEVQEEKWVIGQEARIKSSDSSAWILDINWSFGGAVRCMFQNAATYLAPILDQHQPCEDEFKRDLDRLLERASEPAYIVGIGRAVR